MAYLVESSVDAWQESVFCLLMAFSLLGILQLSIRFRLSDVWRTAGDTNDKLIILWYFEF